MDIRYDSEQVEYQYNGEKLIVTLFRQYWVKYNKESCRMEFKYKGVDVNNHYDNDSPWYSLVDIICKVIENHSKDGYKKFKVNIGVKNEIEKSFIVLNNTVYSPEYSALNLGDYTYHSMGIEMSDGKRLDGSSLFDEDKLYIGQPHKKAQFSKSKTFDNIKNKAINHYKQNKVLPVDEYINKKETDRYINAINELKSIGLNN